MQYALNAGKFAGLLYYTRSRSRVREPLMNILDGGVLEGDSNDAEKEEGMKSKLMGCSARDVSYSSDPSILYNTSPIS